MEPTEELTAPHAYVAGPMSGYEDHNFPAFHHAAKVLRDKGLAVVSPAELDSITHGGPAPSNTEAQYRELLGRDLHAVSGVDLVVVLPGWEDSRGARLEATVAHYLGIPVHAFAPVAATGYAPTRIDVPRAIHGAGWVADDLPSPPSSTAGECSDGPDHGVTLDGEERVTNAATGGQKGRKLARFDLLPWDALWQVSEHYGQGAKKYADHNWRRGYDWSLSIGALARHLALFAAGEDIDAHRDDCPDDCMEHSNTPHPAAIVFHALALLTFMREHPELDDRYMAQRDHSTE